MTSSKRREFCPIIYGKRACCRIVGNILQMKQHIIHYHVPYPFISISDKNVQYFLLHDYRHNFSGSIYINIRRHSKLSFFSFNYDDSFWQKKRSFANTLSSIFHCPPSILLKLSTIFLGDLTWRRRWWWFDPSVTFLYEKTCRCCCCPYGSSPISSSTISFTRWLKYNDILSGK